jgi:hypothetical protein
LIQVGHYCETLVLADGTELTGNLNAHQLNSAIAATEETEGRKLHFVPKPEVAEASDSVVLPTGKLGVTFEGSPPMVTGVFDDSPMIGKARVGMFAVALLLPDGTELSGFSTSELIKAFTATSEVEGRKLILLEKAEKGRCVDNIMLPAGKLGITFKGPDANVAISADSPLQGKIRPGFIPDTLELPDGTVLSGAFNSEDIINALRMSSDQEGRVLTLVKQAEKEGPSDVIPLQPGKLGVTFEGSPATVTAVADDSPLQGKIRAGLVAASLILNDGTDLSGFSTGELIAALKNSVEQEGRELRLVAKGAVREINEDKVDRVLLPAGKLGVVFKGYPATVTGISDESPLAGRIRAGLIAEKLELSDGTEMTGYFTTSELISALKNSSDEEGRMLHLVRKAGTLSAVDTILLPPGKLGVTFKGTPPAVSSVSEQSPLLGFARLGLIADKLILGDGTELSGFTTSELIAALKGSSREEDRKLILVKEPTTTAAADKIMLPRGTLGISFKGTQPTVTGVSDDSPLVGKVRTGLVADTLILADGTEYSGMTSAELMQHLKESSAQEGRQLLLS